MIPAETLSIIQDTTRKAAEITLLREVGDRAYYNVHGELKSIGLVPDEGVIISNTADSFCESVLLVERSKLGLDEVPYVAVSENAVLLFVKSPGAAPIVRARMPLEVTQKYIDIITMDGKQFTSKELLNAIKYELGNVYPDKLIASLSKVSTVTRSQSNNEVVQGRTKGMGEFDRQTVGETPFDERYKVSCMLWIGFHGVINLEPYLDIEPGADLFKLVFPAFRTEEAKFLARLALRDYVSANLDSAGCSISVLMG